MVVVKYSKTYGKTDMESWLKEKHIYGGMTFKKMRNAISSRMHRLSARELYFGACFATVNLFATYV